MPFRSAVLGSLTLVAVLFAAAPARAQTPADEAAIRAGLEGSAMAWNAADLDGHVAMNADSIWFMGQGGPLVGRARSRAALERGFFVDGRPLQQLHYERVSVRFLGADHALVVGRFVLTGGDRPETSGWFSTVWARMGDRWQIIHDHSS